MSDVKDTIATRIRARMDALDLNPFSAANKAGLGQDYVRDILRGKTKNPSAEKLRKLAHALETSIQYLMGAPEGSQIFDFHKGIEITNVLPALPTQSVNDKVAVMLPIKHELVADVWRLATEVSKGPLGYEAATIPPAYRTRENWLELVRDDSMRAVIPKGSLVHVVSHDDVDRGSLNHGDIIVIVKRVFAGEGALHLVERCLRRVNYRYPDLGLWFMDIATGSDEDDFTDDIFKEESREFINLKGERRVSKPSPDPLLSPEEERAREERIQRTVARISSSDPEKQAEMMAMLENDRLKRARIVGKVIRLIAPLQNDARFGIDLGT